MQICLNKLPKKNIYLAAFFAVAALLNTWRAGAQNLTPIYVTAPLTGANTSGVYYNTTSITLGPGFSTQAGLIFQAQILPAGTVPLATLFSPTQNFIVTSVPKVSGLTTTASLLNQNTGTMMQTVEYFDGIDRPLQSIAIKASPGFNDVVQPFAYDAYDREAAKYLPYTSTISDGSYKPDALTPAAGQSLFYASPPAGVATIPTPVAQTGFEPSPLNRVVELGAPGNPWQLSTSGVSGAGQAIKVTYTNNDQGVFSSTYTAGTPNPGSRKVVFYLVTINADGSRSLTNNSSYANSLLSVTITADENWTAAMGCLNTTEEYKDEMGRVVLKRTYNLNNGNPATPFVEMLSTYYVYDDKGDLAFVLPPMASPDIGLTSAANQGRLGNLCYQYNYDGRNRLIGKKLPGKGWEYMVYNQLDQLVLHQDNNERNNANEYEVTKYDAIGRVITSGLWKDANNQSLTTLQAAVYAAAQWDAPAISNSTAYGYIYSSYPTLTIAPLTVNIYDGYANVPGNLITAYSAPPASASYMTQGLLTATLTNVLTTANMLWGVHYYDNLGRVTQSWQQHYFNGQVSINNFDIVTNTYNFNNLVTTTTRQHFNNSASGNTILATGPVVTLTDSYNYDQVNRKTQTFEQVTVGSEQPGPNNLLSQLDYNEIGQLLTKHLFSAAGTALFYQDIGYTYNERGWMLGSAAPLFTEQLQYNSNTLGVAGFSPQFNGNIASQTRTAGATPTTTSYTYLYDNLNRLTSGTSTDNYNETGISYDLAGNIKTLQRTLGTATAIDNLTYTYNIGTSNLNQLQSVTDAAADNSGKGYPSGTFAYGYDANGNMIRDASKGISNTSYNVLNLPNVITLTGGTDTYTYDAGGEKLRKVTTAGAGSTTDYVDGIEYDGGVLQFIQTESGRMMYNSGSPYYEYYLADHLGNTRLTFDTHTTTPTVNQQDDYFPFGYEISRGTITSPKNEYLYNKKELQEDLQVYDYGARFYDPVIGRWHVVDAYAEHPDQVDLSPYAYVGNNPINTEDPDGDCPPCDIDWSGIGSGILQGAENFVRGALTPPVVTIANVVHAAVNGNIKPAVTLLAPGVGKVDQVAALVDSKTSTQDKTAIVTGNVLEVAGAFAGDKVFDMFSGRGPTVDGETTTAKDATALSKEGRSGRQEKLKELAGDDKLGAADRGWLKQEQNEVTSGKRDNMRNPPGKELAHDRGREAAKGYSYKYSKLKNQADHKLQHKFDNNGLKNKERPL